jgi:hypothetical protein
LHPEKKAWESREKELEEGSLKYIGSVHAYRVHIMATPSIHTKIMDWQNPR